MIDPQPRPQSANDDYCIPPPLTGATPDQIKRWVLDGIYYNHPIRLRDFARHRRAELFDQGMQWLRRAYGAMDSSVYASQWVEVYWTKDDPEWVPTPVFNEGVGSRINESARLGRPNYRPVVNPESRQPDLNSKLGAKAQQRHLRHQLRKGGWEDIHGPQFYYHMPLYGGAYWKSELVNSYDETDVIPVDTAERCASCGFTSAGPEIAQGLMPKLAGMGLPENAFKGGRLEQCPKCQTMMQPFSADPSGQDSLGRPLGKLVAIARWELTTRSPYDVFVRNLGFDLRRTGEQPIDEWSEVHVEHLDSWVANRYPMHVDKIRAEDPVMLAMYHPTAGQPDLYPGGLDAKMFKRSVRVKERHKAPWMEKVFDEATGQYVRRMNKGRSAVVIGEEVVFYGNYLLDSINYPGETVPRAVLDYVPWEFRDGGRRLQGLGLWDIMFDPQEAANEIRSQTQAVRQRLAVPLYIALSSQNFDISAMRGGVPGRLAEIDVDPVSPTFVPQMINNETIDAGVKAELEDAVSAIERYAGNVDVEKGTPPPNVSAASAIRLLKEAASEKREPRLNRIKASLRRAFKHGAELGVHMFFEDREMRYEEDDGEQTLSLVNGKAFAKQVNVDVDVEPDFDDKMKAVETVRDLISLQIVVPGNLSPQQSRRIGKLLDAPKELYELEEAQEKAAQREWIDFRDGGRFPRMDPGLDDHGAHLDQHGRDAMTEVFRDLEEKANWDGALAAGLSAAWPQLRTLAMQHHMLMSSLPPPQPGMPSAVPPMPDLQEQIVNLWASILDAAAASVDPATGMVVPGFTPPDEEALIKVMWWRAHMEAHRLEEETRQTLAMAQPVAAQPGADATAAGNQTAPGAAPAQPATAVA